MTLLLMNMVMRQYVYVNREVVTIRGILAGQYQVAAHVYAMKPRPKMLIQMKIH